MSDRNMDFCYLGGTAWGEGGQGIRDGVDACMAGLLALIGCVRLHHHGSRRVRAHATGDLCLCLQAVNAGVWGNSGGGWNGYQVGVLMRGMMCDVLAT